MKKSALLLIFAVAAFFPSKAFASSFVDDSEYGQQSFNVHSCDGFFTDFAASQAQCFQSLFTNPNGPQTNGYLVEWSNSPTVGDIEVTFSGLTVGDFGLVICGDGTNEACGDGTSTADLDTSNPAYPNLFSSTSTAQSVAFDVSGIVHLDPLRLGQHGNEVAFLVLGDSIGNLPTITVRSLDAAAVPEPGSLLLVSSGVLTFLRARRRKK